MGGGGGGEFLEAATLANQETWFIHFVMITPISTGTAH